MLSSTARKIEQIKARLATEEVDEWDRETLVDTLAALEQLYK